MPNDDGMSDVNSWRLLPARIVPGHRVASGENGNPHFPGGTLKMQMPFFRALGLDLSVYHRRPLAAGASCGSAARTLC